MIFGLMVDFIMTIFGFDEREDADEATIDADGANIILIGFHSMVGTGVGMTMFVVMVAVLYLNQRPAKRLSEAVADLDSLYLNLVHENGEFVLLSVTTRAVTETL